MLRPPRLWLRMPAVACALALCGAGPVTGDAESVKACIQANFPQRTSLQRVELESVDRAGQSRTLHAILRWKRMAGEGSRIVIRVQAPADLRDAAYLMIENEPEDEMFMYLPSAQKVRRITSRTMSDELWGTDFSYEDFKALQTTAISGRSALIGEDVVAGRPVWVLELERRSEEASAYSRIESRVDRETCLPLETRFFERGDKPRKVLRSKREDLERVDGRWVAMRVDMADERDGTHTELRVMTVENDVDIPDYEFSPSRLPR